MINKSDIGRFAREMLTEAGSLLSEVVLGKPVVARADCVVFLDQVCTTCGSCGADKRRYQRYCYECNTCTSGCAYCPKGCVCHWC